MVYYILKYTGPPCREHCGYYEPWHVHLLFETLEESLVWLLTKILDNFTGWDNYIVSKGETITDGVFCYPWIETQMKMSSNIPRLDKFLLNGENWSEKVIELIRKKVSIITIKLDTDDDTL